MEHDISWWLYADDAPEVLHGLAGLLTPEERARIRAEVMAEEDEDDA